MGFSFDQGKPNDYLLVNATENTNGQFDYNQENATLHLDVLKRQGLSQFQSAVILISFAYGSAVVILPNTLLKLGELTWPLLLSAVIIVIAYCTYLNNHSTNFALVHPHRSDDVVREPYATIAEIAGGPLFRRFVVVVIYISLLTSALAYVLLSATMINNTFPFMSFKIYNSVRIWITILCLLITPLMFYGTLVDISGTAVFAVWASSISLLAVLVNCLLLHLCNAKFPSSVPSSRGYAEELFIAFGLFTFALGGPSLVVPNVTVYVTNTEKFPRTIAIIFLVLGILYGTAGVVPYVALGNATQESVGTTFNQFNSLTMVIPVLTATSDISMSLHLLMEAILTMNPVYQHLESTLDVPTERNWKRFAIRMLGVVSIYFLCMLFPMFRSVLSLVGGIPVTLVGVVFPLVIHTMIFENSLFTNLVHFFVLLFFLTFMVGNFVFSLERVGGYVLSHDFFKI